MLKAHHPLTTRLAKWQSWAQLATSVICMVLSSQLTFHLVGQTATHQLQSLLKMHPLELQAEIFQESMPP